MAPKPTLRHGDLMPPETPELPTNNTQTIGVTYDTTVKRLQVGIKPAKPAASFDLRDSKTFGVR